MRFFQLLLPGATLRNRLFFSIAAVFAVGLTGFIGSVVTGGEIGTALLVAPIGASAVLVFAVPTSPMAQPWPVIGGNTISALVGVAVGLMVPIDAIAAGLAVGLAIIVMTLTRSLHPPGGAAALLAVVGGSGIEELGFGYAFVPVGIDALLLTLIAIVVHRMASLTYPSRPATAPVQPERSTVPASLFEEEDFDGAIEELGEPFDISREDLERIVRKVEQHALARRQSGRAQRTAKVP